MLDKIIDKSTKKLPFHTFCEERNEEKHSVL